MDNTQVASRQVFAYRWITRSVLTMVALGVGYVLICQCSNRVTVVNLSSGSVTLRSMERQEQNASNRIQFEPAGPQSLLCDRVIAPLDSHTVVLRKSLTIPRVVVLDLKLRAASSHPSICLEVFPWGARDFIVCQDGLPGITVRREMTVLRGVYEHAKQRVPVLLNLP
ncbi:MAG: hypothetical protein AABP62_04940 [Planctomycetota bacterium]